MRRLSVSVVLLVLLGPVGARAQSVTPADLAGEWTRMMAEWRRDAGGNIVHFYDTLVIRADSTYRMGNKNGAGTYERWNYLKGDTISFHENGACVQGTKTCRITNTKEIYCGAPPTPGKPEVSGGSWRDCLIGEPGFRITLKDQQLILTPLGNTNDNYLTGTYTRVGTAQPTP